MQSFCQVTGKAINIDSGLIAIKDVVDPNRYIKISKETISYLPSFFSDDTKQLARLAHAWPQTRDITELHQGVWVFNETHCRIMPSASMSHACKYVEETIHATCGNCVIIHILVNGKLVKTFKKEGTTMNSQVRTCYITGKSFDATKGSYANDKISPEGLNSVPEFLKTRGDALVTFANAYRKHRDVWGRNPSLACVWVLNAREETFNFFKTRGEVVEHLDSLNGFGHSYDCYVFDHMMLFCTAHIDDLHLKFGNVYINRKEFNKLPAWLTTNPDGTVNRTRMKNFMFAWSSWCSYHEQKPLSHFNDGIWLFNETVNAVFDGKLDKSPFQSVDEVVEWVRIAPLKSATTMHVSDNGKLMYTFEYADGVLKETSHLPKQEDSPKKPTFLCSMMGGYPIAVLGTDPAFEKDGIVLSKEAFAQLPADLASCRGFAAAEERLCKFVRAWTKTSRTVYRFL